MSMIGHVRRIDANELAALLVDPDSVGEQLVEWCEDEETLPDRLYLYKEWDTFNRTLATLAEHPGREQLQSAVFGGTPVGDDVGYGPLMYLAVADVAQIAAAFAGLTEADTRAAIAATDYGEAYSGDFVTEPEGADAVVDLVTRAGTFYAESAKTGSAVIVWLD